MNEVVGLQLRNQDAYAILENNTFLKKLYDSVS